MNFIKKLFVKKQIGSAYDYSFTANANSTPIPLSQYQGNVILIVNTASKCGFTPQYKALEKLYQQYKNSGLVVIGVPCNDFAKQEPGSDAEIANFCEINYGVTFPITHKEHVRGQQRHPFYQWAYNVFGFGSAPKWNFHKILIDKKGNVRDYFYSLTKPDSSEVINAIEKLLKEN